MPRSIITISLACSVFCILSGCADTEGRIETFGSGPVSSMHVPAGFSIAEVSGVPAEKRWSIQLTASKERSIFISVVETNVSGVGSGELWLRARDPAESELSEVELTNGKWTLVRDLETGDYAVATNDGKYEILIFIQQCMREGDAVKEFLANIVFRQ